MKCHKCGAYIPEGHMYCDECGAEIKIVPDFEPEIENEIDSTMSSIAGTFVKDENNKKREVQEKDEEEDDVYAFIRDKRKTVIKNKGQKGFLSNFFPQKKFAGQGLALVGFGAKPQSP